MKKKKTRTKKSDHKHIYSPCLLKVKDKNRESYMSAVYCTICHKISNVKFFETTKNYDENGKAYYSVKNEQEVIEEHKNDPLIEVNKEDIL